MLLVKRSGVDDGSELSTDWSPYIMFVGAILFKSLTVILSIQEYKHWSQGTVRVKFRQGTRQRLHLHRKRYRFRRYEPLWGNLTERFLSFNTRNFLLLSPKRELAPESITCSLCHCPRVVFLSKSFPSQFRLYPVLPAKCLSFQWTTIPSKGNGYNLCGQCNVRQCVLDRPKN